jgi:bifunctional oligoribonuclease and PAP phosphatase NrnA
MENIQVFQAFLSSPKKAVIVTHFKPDADALGSSLGLALYLKKKGHIAQVITPSDYPDFLTWMPGNNDVIIYGKDKVNHVHQHIKAADVIFCLDFNSLKRINDMGQMVAESTSVKVLIDHHLEPEHFAQFVQWDVTAASTAELVFELIQQLGDVSLIDSDIADCLYAGIMTDTGSFRHPNTTSKVFEIASVLVRQGADPAKVSRLVYDTNTPERLRLMGFVLSEKLHVLPELRTAYITLSAEDLKKYGSQTGDTEGLVNFGLSIKG